MTKSPLARVVASKPVPAPVVAEKIINHMLGEQPRTTPPTLSDFIDDLVASQPTTPAPKGWDKVETSTPQIGGLRKLRECPKCGLGQPDSHVCSRPDFGQFIDDFCEKNKITYTPYVDTEAKTRADTARITAALSEHFPDWDVHEAIEGADYKPPFSASWTFTRKAGGK